MIQSPPSRQRPVGAEICRDGPDEVRRWIKRAARGATTVRRPGAAGRLLPRGRLRPPPASGPPGPADPAASGPPGGACWPGRVPGWTRNAVIRHLVVLLGYLGAGILFTWPRLTYLPDHKLPATRDAGAYVWGFWWFARQVAHLSNPWFTKYLAAPVGSQLGFHALMPLPSLLLTPVTLAYGPSASYNLLSVLMPGLACYAMYRCARLWVRSQTAAIAAGAFFGLSSMIAYQSWYLVNLPAGELFIPLALEAAVLLRRRPGWLRAVALGVIVGASLLTDQESAILVAIVAVLALLPWVLFGSRAAAAEPAAGSGAAAEVSAPERAAAAGPAVADAGQAAPGAAGRRGRPRGGQSADHRHGSAGGGARCLGPGDFAGQLVQLLRGGTAGAVRPLAQSRQVRPDQAGVRVLLPRHRLPSRRTAPPGHQQRGHPDVRPGADHPGRVRPRPVLATAQRVAAGPDVAGVRGAGPGTGPVDRRQPRVRALRRDFPRRAAVRDHAVHPVRSDSRHVQLPGGRPAGDTRAAGRGAARRKHRGLAAISRQAGGGRRGRGSRGTGAQRARARLVGQSARPGDARPPCTRGRCPPRCRSSTGPSPPTTPSRSWWTSRSACAAGSRTTASSSRPSHRCWPPRTGTRLPTATSPACPRRPSPGWKSTRSTSG